MFAHKDLNGYRLSLSKYLELEWLDYVLVYIYSLMKIQAALKELTTLICIPVSNVLDILGT